MDLLMEIRMSRKATNELKTARETEGRMKGLSVGEKGVNLFARKCDGVDAVVDVSTIWLRDGAICALCERLDLNVAHEMFGVV